MKLRSLLAAGAVSLALTAMVVPAAQAQYSESSNTRRDRDKAKAKKPEVMFPAATRKDVEPKPSRLAKQVTRMFDFYDKQKYDDAIKAAEELAANGKASANDRAQAWYVAGYSALEQDSESYVRAIGYLSKALEADGLVNNTHYQVMLQVAQMLVAEEKYDQALAMADRFLTETKSNKAEALVMKGNALYRLERYPEAIAALKQAVDGSEKPQESWTQLLMASYLESDQPLLAAAIAEKTAAAKPDDKRAQLNLVGIYLQADQPEKAGQVFDRMRAANMLTESKDYESAYRLLANIEGREKDAVALINEGLSKNILQPSHEVYSFLGQFHYFADQIPEAIAAWQKAAPLAKDGETYLNLAKVLIQEGRWEEGKAAAKQAIAKGVKKMGDAWMTVARAEFGDTGKNRPAIMSAYYEAAKYPETKAQAEKAMAQLSQR